MKTETATKLQDLNPANKMKLLTITPKQQSEKHRVPHLLLAHGAGSPMTSPFMETLCADLADAGIPTSRFEFSYMAERRETGKRRPPPRADKLIPEYLDAIDQVRKSSQAADAPLAIGGKSMGGRVASMLAADQHKAGNVCALVCLGYPFHPPKNPGKLRISHLSELDCPTLIVQGERDALGNSDEVASYSLNGATDFHWAPDGDHDLKPRVRSGHTHETNIENAAAAIARFLKNIE